MYLVQYFYNDTELVSYLGPKVWEQIPSEFKNKSREGFRQEIKKSKAVDCLCKICKIYSLNLGFL